MNFKNGSIAYTPDNKKVVYAKKLNNEQSIVREIVSSGDKEVERDDEICVQTSKLSVSPYESYDVKRTRSMEECSKKLRKEIDSLTVEKRAERDKLANLREMYESSRILAESLSSETFETLVDVMSGNIEWVVEEYSYQASVVHRFDEYIATNREFDSFGVKLLSLYGKSKGDCSFRVSRYSDGSGTYIGVKFFRTYEDAMEHIKTSADKMIDDDKLTVRDYVSYVESGIVFNKKRTAKMETKKRKYIQKEIDDRKSKIDKLQKQILEIEGGK